jgi:hypothetical protein
MLSEVEASLLKSEVGLPAFVLDFDLIARTTALSTSLDKSALFLHVVDT